MSKQHLKKGSLFFALLLTVGTIVAADCIRRDFFSSYDNSIIVEGDFKNSQASVQQENTSSAPLAGDTQSTSQSSSGISYLGYSELPIPASQLSSGLLAIIDSLHPSSYTSPALVNLSDVKNEFYSVRSEELTLDSDAAAALNLMMLDYNTATGLSDFIVYSTTQAYTAEDSVCPNAFPESASGFTIDLAIQGIDMVLEYDGMDEESWIIENCTRYGFIVRYPQGKETITGQSSCVWHLRYVGRVHAAVMSQNGLCLDEYYSWLKTYSIDNPLSIQLDGMNYIIYYTAYMGDSTPVRVPVSGNYDISGNNIDGFVITAVK